MKTDIQLTWEWPGSRKPDRQLTVTISSIEKDAAKLVESPSITSNLPQPMRVLCVVAPDNGDWAGKTICIVIPKPEIGSLAKGDKAVLHVLGQNLCIGIKK